ncbi:hypothetical protein ACIQ9P_07340 [Kitasatospora sp. NPDC094019]|uniref:hypothetical protein n=1 Tax=Kitasatospora sp. NPDC094019 TaxID=3364091 RepID=UPI00381C25CF
MTTNTQYGPEPEPDDGSLPAPAPAPAAPAAPAPTAPVAEGPSAPEPAAEGPTAADRAAPGGWSALVYGRTLQVDQWWRALPAGVDRQGAVADAVRAVVAGGSRLEAGPRFLLHRDAHGVLVGAACELGLISPTMVHDRFGRPLYGFVGWHRAAGPGAAVGRIPELAELTKYLAEWAGPVYAEWIAPTWEAVGREEAEPRTTRPVAAPWRGVPASAPTAAVWLPAHSAGTHLLPESDAAALWAAAAASRDRCLLATGWRRRSDPTAHRFTHLTSADCRVYELLRPPPPPPPPPPPLPPRPAPVAGPGPLGGSAGYDGRTGRDGGSADQESSIGEALRAGRRALRWVTRGLLASEGPDPAEQAGTAGKAGTRRHGDDPATGRGYYGDLDGPSTGRPQPPGGAYPTSMYPTPTGPAATGPASGPASTDPASTDEGPTDRGPVGRAAPGHPAERPSYRRAHAVDPQHADLSNMFGEFDEPEPPPVTPGDPSEGRPEGRGPQATDDIAKGESS